MKRVEMIKTANPSDRLQYRVLSQGISAMQRLRLHCAILLGITQRILALKNDLLDYCTEYGAELCRS